MADELSTDVELYAEFEQFLATSGDDLVEDPTEAQRSIVQRILKGATFDEIFGETEAVHARDLLDEPLSIRGFKLAKGDFEDGLGYFAVIDAMAMKTGEVIVVTCGATNVLAQLYAAQRAGLFPIDVRFTEPEKATAKGYKPLWLRKLDTF